MSISHLEVVKRGNLEPTLIFLSSSLSAVFGTERVGHLLCGGVLHGLASITLRLWSKTKIQLPYWLSWFITFQFVNLAWIYFRSTTVEQANTIIAKMFNPDWSELATFFTHPVRSFTEAATHQYGFISFNNPKIIVASLVLLLVVAFFSKNSIQLIENFKYDWSRIVYTQTLLIILLVSVFFMQKNSVFLYFNF